MKRITMLLTSCCFVLGTQAIGATLNLNTHKIGVSGLSSGGYMANQFHIAHSDWVDKVGIIAGGPYYCARNNIKTALDQCVSKSNDETSTRLTLQAKAYEKQKLIASLDNIKTAKVWLFRGTHDQKIHSDVSNALYQQYSMWMPDTQIEYVNDQPFAHHFPSLNYGTGCNISAPPFIGNCNYDAAGVMLKSLYPLLQIRNEQPQGLLVTINQHTLGGENASSLDEHGYLYVPQSCQQGEECMLHINFHGCQQNAQSVDTQYVEHNGLNNWADSNLMVVFYPQTRNSLFMPLNPQGCWDWWGYTGDDYATKNAPQIQGIKQIAESLTQFKLKEI